MPHIKSSTFAPHSNYSSYANTMAGHLSSTNGCRRHPHTEYLALTTAQPTYTHHLTTNFTTGRGICTADPPSLPPFCTLKGEHGIHVHVPCKYVGGKTLVQPRPRAQGLDYLITLQQGVLSSSRIKRQELLEAKR